jgi:hypothetical protein
MDIDFSPYWRLRWLDFPSSAVFHSNDAVRLSLWSEDTQCTPVKRTVVSKWVISDPHVNDICAFCPRWPLVAIRPLLRMPGVLPNSSTHRRTRYPAASGGSSHIRPLGLKRRARKRLIGSLDG